MGRILTMYPAQPQVLQMVTLGETQNQLRVTWRERLNAWYADLYTSGMVPIWLGQRVSTQWALGLGLQPESKPEGIFLVRGPAEYVRENLGSSVQIVFYPADELPAASVADDDITVTVP